MGNRRGKKRRKRRDGPGAKLNKTFSGLLINRDKEEPFLLIPLVSCHATIRAQDIIITKEEKGKEEEANLIGYAKEEKDPGWERMTCLIFGEHYFPEKVRAFTGPFRRGKIETLFRETEEGSKKQQY